MGIWERAWRLRYCPEVLLSNTSSTSKIHHDSPLERHICKTCIYDRELAAQLSVWDVPVKKHCQGEAWQCLIACVVTDALGQSDRTVAANQMALTLTHILTRQLSSAFNTDTKELCCSTISTANLAVIRLPTLTPKAFIGHSLKYYWIKTKLNKTTKCVIGAMTLVYFGFQHFQNNFNCLTENHLKQR